MFEKRALQLIRGVAPLAGTCRWLVFLNTKPNSCSHLADLRLQACLVSTAKSKAVSLAKTFSERAGIRGTSSAIALSSSAGEDKGASGKKQLEMKKQA